MFALSAFLDQVQGGWWVGYWRIAEIALLAVSVVVALVVGSLWGRRRGQMPGLLAGEGGPMRTLTRLGVALTIANLAQMATVLLDDLLGHLLALNVGLLALEVLAELAFWGWLARIAWEGSRERPALIWLTVAACCFVLAHWPQAGWLLSNSVWSDGLRALAVLALGAFAWRYGRTVLQGAT